MKKSSGVPNRRKVCLGHIHMSAFMIHVVQIPIILPIACQESLLSLHFQTWWEVDSTQKYRSIRQRFTPLPQFRPTPSVSLRIWVQYRWGGGRGSILVWWHTEEAHKLEWSAIVEMGLPNIHLRCEPIEISSAIWLLRPNKLNRVTNKHKTPLQAEC